MSTGLLNLRLGLVLWSGVVLAHAMPQHSAPQYKYYDTRERVAATMTFKWAEHAFIRIPAEWVVERNTMMRHYVTSLAQSAGYPLGTFDDLLKKSLIDERIATTLFEVSNYYTVERTPQQIRIEAQRQAIHVSEAKVVETPFVDEAYLQGNLLITVFRDLSNGQISAVRLAQCGADMLGLGSPLGEVHPEWLVVFAGVSPFRLYGRKPRDWRLVSVTPEEWIFELPQGPENEPTKQENEPAELGEQGDEATRNAVQPSGLRAPYVRFHLDRRYQDALSRLEIRYSDDTIYTWRTLRYKRIENVWFPSEMELIVKSHSEESQSKVVLISARRTKSPIELQIPEKTPVYDYRRWGIEAWVGMPEPDLTEWSEELLKSLHQPTKEPVASPKR